MAGMSEKIKHLGKAVRGAVSPRAWAESYIGELDRNQREYKERKLSKGMDETLRRNPRLKKSYLGGK